jgi:hypothetical protein
MNFKNPVPLAQKLGALTSNHDSIRFLFSLNSITVGFKTKEIGPNLMNIAVKNKKITVIVEKPKEFGILKGFLDIITPELNYFHISKLRW